MYFVAVLLACAGCAMFDESAAVPAAEEYDTHPNDAQPLGPYSCTIAEAGGCGAQGPLVKRKSTHDHLCGFWCGGRMGTQMCVTFLTAASPSSQLCSTHIKLVPPATAAAASTCCCPSTPQTKCSS